MAREHPVLDQPVPVIAPGHTFASITDKVTGVVLTRQTPFWWYGAFLVTAGIAGMLGVSLAYLVFKGVGIWGNNQPVGWAFDITNFVWWIGIGHAGTLISAILLLFRQTWRTSAPDRSKRTISTPPSATRVSTSRCGRLSFMIGRDLPALPGGKEA